MSVRPQGFAESSRPHIQISYLLRRVGEALTLLRRELLPVVRPVLILLLLLRLRAELLLLLIGLTRVFHAALAGRWIGGYAENIAFLLRESAACKSQDCSSWIIA